MGMPKIAACGRVHERDRAQRPRRATKGAVALTIVPTGSPVRQPLAGFEAGEEHSPDAPRRQPYQPPAESHRETACCTPPARRVQPSPPPQRAESHSRETSLATGFSISTCDPSATSSSRNRYVAGVVSVATMATDGQSAGIERTTCTRGFEKPSSGDSVREVITCTSRTPRSSRFRHVACGNRAAPSDQHAIRALPTSSSSPPAVDNEVLTRHVRGRIRREEDRRANHVGGSAIRPSGVRDSYCETKRAGCASATPPGDTRIEADSPLVRSAWRGGGSWREPRPLWRSTHSASSGPCRCTLPS